MNKSMKFLTLLQLSVLGASAAFIYNKDLKSDLSKKISSYMKGSPTIYGAKIAEVKISKTSSPVVAASDESEIQSELNLDAGISYNDHAHVEVQKFTSATVNYALLYEKISFSSIQAKSWDVDFVEFANSEETILVSNNQDQSEYLEMEETQISELITEEVSAHFGFVQEEKVVVESWASAFKGIEIEEVIAAKEQDEYQETVSEDVISHNRAEQEKIASDLIDEVASAASSMQNKLDEEVDESLGADDYSPTKLQFSKLNKKELNTQDDLKLGKQNLQKIKKIDFNKMLEESNVEFEKLESEDVAIDSKGDDYSERGAEISSNVSVAIQREMEKRAATNKSSGSAKSQPILAQALTTQMKASTEMRDEMKLERTVKKSSKNGDDLKSRITAFGLDLENGSSAEIKGFDLSYSYEYNSNQSDENTGAVDFTLKSNSSSNILRVNLRGDNGYIASNSDLALEDGVQFSIPLLSREGLYKFFEKKGLNGIGSIVFVELSETTTSVDISSAYEGKIYFDENFKELEAQEAAHYVMFVGVKPGNSLLSFQTVDDEVVDKIINTTEDELYFETNDYYAAKKETVQLFEKKLMSNERIPLELFKDKINYFNTNIQFEKKSQNTYSYHRPRMALGMRKYFEINRDQGLLVVGYGDNSQIEIPSESLIGEYQSILGNESEQSCYIQTNIEGKKELKSVQYNGHTTHGDASNMSIDMLAIDSDGQHGDEIADKTKIIILSSNQQGTISLRVDYQDNTSQIFNTFCSPGTYLIEQL